MKPYDSILYFFPLKYQFHKFPHNLHSPINPNLTNPPFTIQQDSLPLLKTTITFTYCISEQRQTKIYIARLCPFKNNIQVKMSGNEPNQEHLLHDDFTLLKDDSGVTKPSNEINKPPPKTTNHQQNPENTNQPQNSYSLIPILPFESTRHHPRNAPSSQIPQQSRQSHISTLTRSLPDNSTLRWSNIPSQISEAPPHSFFIIRNPPTSRISGTSTIRLLDSISLLGRTVLPPQHQNERSAMNKILEQSLNKIRWPTLNENHQQLVTTRISVDFTYLVPK